MVWTLEEAMRLTFESFDGRRRIYRKIIDQDTGKQVGNIRANGVGFIAWGVSGRGGIEVSLFDGKYETTVNRYEECWAYVKGVEAVLDHVIGSS
jgi:hypothetical protein